MKCLYPSTRTKRNPQLFASASAALLLGASVLAQEPSATTTNAAPDNLSRTPAAFRSNRLNTALKASDLLGMTVKNFRDEKLAKVDDLAVDVESGRIVQVILSTSGFLNIGDTQTAVPPGALHYDSTNKIIHLDADKAKLAAAPKLLMSNWTEASDDSHLTAVYRLYGEQAAYDFVQKSESSAGTNAPGIDNRARIPTSRLSHLQRVSTLTELSVRNLQGEKLGKVQDILLDLPSGRIVAVVVSSGGFLGIGNELSAVPPTALRFIPTPESLQLDATKEMLGQAPHFRADQWPDFAQPATAEVIYRAYKVEPYFSTNTTAEPGNTASNARDRDNATLTPLDQGNNAADVNTTAQIRKEIVAGKEMSMNAKNVKIMTLDGRVTLRGPVDSAEEKRLIGEIAGRAVPSANVSNQLEVTTADPASP